MRDFNIAGRDVNVDNSKGDKGKPWLKIVLALIGAAGVIIAAIIGLLGQK